MNMPVGVSRHTAHRSPNELVLKWESMADTCTIDCNGAKIDVN